MKQLQLKLIQGAGYVQINNGNFEAAFGCDEPIFNASVISYDEVAIEVSEEGNQFVMRLDAQTSLDLARTLLDCYSCCKQKERELYADGSLP